MEENATVDFFFRIVVFIANRSRKSISTVIRIFQLNIKRLSHKDVRPPLIKSEPNVPITCPKNIVKKSRQIISSNKKKTKKNFSNNCFACLMINEWLPTQLTSECIFFFSSDIILWHSMHKLLTNETCLCAALCR